MSGVLLVAATERELDGRDGLVCGIGPVEAAAATARALALRPPAAVLHVGVAGGRGLAAGNARDRHRGCLLRSRGVDRAGRQGTRRCAAARRRAAGTPRRSDAPDRDERGRRERRSRRRGRGNGGLRRPPCREPRRACRRSRSGRSRTRSASLTARSGRSTRRSMRSSAVTPALLEAIAAAVR